MIRVICKDNKIVYNAYHLAKAFLPDAEVASEVSEDSDSRITVLLGGPGNCQGPVLCENVLIAEDIRELYIKMRELTGRDMPWGMLTGVRPTKLASKWIEENINSYPSEAEAREAFVKWFYEDRFVSRAKAETAFNVAMKEKSIMPDSCRKGFSLYIGIPFCPTVCSYCSFSSGEIGTYRDKVEDYLKALEHEMELTKERMLSEGKLAKHGNDTESAVKETEKGSSKRHIFPDTVYMGGGTPTSITAEQLDRLMTKADELFCIPEGLRTGQIREYTVEAGRPDSITMEKLEVIKKHGVTRISVNPQSMQQKTLDVIGRHHTTQQVREAFALAREMGFDNINMDIIAGLPGEDNEDVRDTLRQIQELNPDSLTVHSLAIKRSSRIGIEKKISESRLSRKQSTGEYLINSAGTAGIEPVPAEAEAETVETEAAVSKTETDIGKMISDAAEAAAQMGMEPYYLYRQKSIAGNFENIGYARPGKEGLYNVLIMEEVQSIMGCGAGATTKTVTENPVPNPGRKGQLTHLIRSENVKNIEEYIRKYS
ncbi:MAG: coproporphyrinogen III oxidase family protein [Parasporobacterium sp.]|nr:coproporphyrinogen III oxidase family protein [Parasporobacterium sp.]